MLPISLNLEGLMSTQCCFGSRPLYTINNVCPALPGRTLDVLKFFWKLEQLLVFFLCLLCGQTLCCWNDYSYPGNMLIIYIFNDLKKPLHTTF